MNIQKNEEYVVEIIDNGYEGEGIAKIDDFTIFVQGAILGEKVKIVIVKVLKSYAYGKIIEFINKSKYRQEPDCNTYKRCGGCNLRHIKYKETLNLKQNIVQNLVNKALINKITVEQTVGMKNPYHYRNKAQYPVGIDKEGNPIIGVFANRTHDVIPMQNCLIQDTESENIAKFILEFIKQNDISVYNENTKKGLFRHIVIKKGLKTEQLMCILVINGRNIPYEKELIAKLNNKFPNIKSIIKNINIKNTNVILGTENINIYGNEYIEDIMGEYVFRISPLSFYQVNPVQAENLYNLAVDMAEISKNDVVFDLYCGIGTISIFVAKYAKKVYGVEIVKEAVDMAIENAKRNHVENIEFLDGDAEYVVDKLINDDGITADVVIFDPPRKGLDNKTIDNILKILPKKVVYISCNPATLVRDLTKFENYYDVLKIQPVDMFPFTSHVECVSVLELKESTEK